MVGCKVRAAVDRVEQLYKLSNTQVSKQSNDTLQVVDKSNYDVTYR